MARIIVLWEHPKGLTGQQAVAWGQAEAAPLLALPAVASVEISRLEDASPHACRAWDWMLTVSLHASAAPEELTDSDPWTSWLLDLQRLGLRPAAALYRDPVDAEAAR